MANIKEDAPQPATDVKYLRPDALPGLMLVTAKFRGTSVAPSTVDRRWVFSRTDEGDGDVVVGRAEVRLQPGVVLALEPGDCVTPLRRRSTATAHRTLLVEPEYVTQQFDSNQAQFQLRKTVSQERRLEQDIVLGIRKAIRDLRSSQEGVFAAERSVAAASEQLRAERIRLDNGESTPFNVLQRESDLVMAESGKINALQTYRNSTTNLDRAQGTILKTHRIKIDEVGALR